MKVHVPAGFRSIVICLKLRAAFIANKEQVTYPSTPPGPDERGFVPQSQFYQMVIGQGLHC